ncbi:hypothetical protein B9Z55_014190 [Caenorhabditis nigoni]|nr:hypothetical protein B9Z55_014190 [Caenorhabditis nigoni]
MSSYQVLVARVDCFSETPVSTYGKFLRQQVEGIMECFTSETVRKKNIDDMKEAEEAALEVKEKVRLRRIRNLKVIRNSRQSRKRRKLPERQNVSLKK